MYLSFTETLKNIWAWTPQRLTRQPLFQDNKADVILKYNADEARSLKAYGELPEHGELNRTRHANTADTGSKNWTVTVVKQVQEFIYSAWCKLCLQVNTVYSAQMRLWQTDFIT